MSTTSSSRSINDLIESGRQKRLQISPEEQREATRRILDRVRQPNSVSDAPEVGETSGLIAKLKPSSIRQRGLFWLSQLGAFAEAMMKGKYNSAMAIRAYEMVQSIS